jgi:hypothetical protein
MCCYLLRELDARRGCRAMSLVCSIYLFIYLFIYSDADNHLLGTTTAQKKHYKISKPPGIIYVGGER